MRQRVPWPVTAVIGLTALLCAALFTAGCASKPNLTIEADPPLLGDYKIDYNHPVPVLVKRQTQAEALKACNDFEPPRKYDGPDAHWDWCDCMEDQEAGDTTRRFVQECRQVPEPPAITARENANIDQQAEIERLRVENDHLRDRLGGLEDAQADLNGFHEGCTPITTRNKVFPEATTRYFGLPEAADGFLHLVACKVEQHLLLGGEG